MVFSSSGIFLHNPPHTQQIRGLRLVLRAHSLPERMQALPQARECVQRMDAWKHPSERNPRA
jgi:hypothetical protein